MTVQIALCDDETAELEKTENILGAYEREHPDYCFVVQRFESTDELLAMVEQKHYMPDMIFLDIYMPGPQGEQIPLGMAAANALRRMGCGAVLFFLTTSREHALDAFEVEAACYLVKPISADELASKLDRFLEAAEQGRRKHILLKKEGSVIKISLNDILYCEAQGKRQCIYMADGTEIFQNSTMAKLYEMCSVGREFVRLGASYIINLEHIDTLNAQELKMDNGETIYLPRGTFRSLREQYFDYYCSV